MEFVRYWNPEPAQIQFNDLAERTGYTEPRVFALDHETVSPFRVKGYVSWLSGQEFQFVWWLTNKWRSTCSGTLEKYFNYLGWADENDWCLKIYPDENFRWMTENNHIQPIAELHRSDNEAHPGATLLEVEITPDNSIWNRFPWLPISGSEEIHYSPLLNHTVNVYGVYCFDQGHGGRPEIHPMDAIWWKDWAYDVPGYRSRWYFGVFQDCSDRFNKNWSEAPRAINFYVPFSLELPEESNSTQSFNADITPEYTNNVITETVFGPDEVNSEWQKDILGPDGKKIDIEVHEFQDSYQHIDIRHVGRQGTTYYGLIKTSVAVGKEGVYFGKIEMTQSGFRSTRRKTTMDKDTTAVMKPRMPQLKLQLVETQGPAVVREHDKDYLEYILKIAVQQDSVALTGPWKWYYYLPDASSGSYWGEGVSLPNTTDNIRYMLRLGDPDVLIRAAATNTDGVSVSGKIRLTGLKLKSPMSALTEFDEFPQLLWLKDNACRFPRRSSLR